MGDASRGEPGEFQPDFGDDQGRDRLLRAVQGQGLQGRHPPVSGGSPQLPGPDGQTLGRIPARGQKYPFLDKYMEGKSFEKSFLK